MNAQTTPTSGARAPAKVPTQQTKPVVAGQASASSPLPAAASTPAAQPDSGLGATAAFIEPEQRRAMIAEAAYYHAERRGFEAGHELEDWCLAEGEIDDKLTRGEMPAVCG
jgi:hypothetical protein